MPELALTRRLGIQQNQSLSPRLQKAVKLLQMPTADFLQAIDDALGQNPFLEKDDAPAGAAPAAATDPADETLSAERLEAAANWGASIAERNGGRGAGTDVSALDFVADPVSLHAHLHGQLRLLRLPERTFLLASAIVESLDEDGYLRTPLEEVASLIDEAVRPAELHAALEAVQSLDPVGVGARDLVECLMLQLDDIGCDTERALCRRMLIEGRAALQATDVRGLARTLGCPPDVAQAGLQRLRQLDPHPGWRFGGQPAPYIEPDILVRKVRGQWTAALNDAVVPRVRLNQAYADVLGRQREGSTSQLTAQLSEARWTVHYIEQRFSTILSVADAILRRQQHFLNYGPMAMRPLALRDIAQEVGVHESTVCRVTNNKFMATPSGTFELKYFFSRGMNADDGASFSPIAVRGLVHEIIAGEPKAAPLSDVAISELLHRQGIRVARRTVTKYRQQLGLQPAERRGARLAS